MKDTLDQIKVFLKQSSRENKIKKMIIKGSFVLIHISNCLDTWKKDYEGFWQAESQFKNTFSDLHMIDDMYLIKHKSIIIRKNQLTVLVIQKDGIIR